MWTKLFSILRNIGIEENIIKLIENLYNNQSAIIQVGTYYSKPAQIEKGVRQGCLISPSLFNIYAEEMMNEALENINGVRINGEIIKTIKFADDQAIIATRRKDLMEMLEKINTTVELYGMKININKTKCMTFSKKPNIMNITIGGNKIEQVKKFRYLGQVLTEDAKCTEEIVTRIGQGKQAFKKKERLITTINMDEKLRKRILEAYVWNTALYAAETWTLSKKDEQKLEAFEMWCWRRFNKVKWTDKKTNEEVLVITDEKRKFLHKIKTRRGRWFGHNLRLSKWFTLIVEGKISGRRPRGPPRKDFIKQILVDTHSSSYQELKKKAFERKEWRRCFTSATHQSID